MTKGLSYNHKELYPNKKCLSSSQFLTYEKNPKAFYTEYVLGLKKESSAMMFGKIFSAAFADRKFDWKKAMQENGITNARLYDVMEQALKAIPEIPKKNCEPALKCKYRGWTFRATLDGYIPESHDNIENKTGQTIWTQERVNFSDQITFQNWVKWQKDGVQFRRNYLNWVDTRAKATQIVKSFRTTRSLKMLKNFTNRVDAVIDGIEVGNFTSPIYIPAYV